MKSLFLILACLIVVGIRVSVNADSPAHFSPPADAKYLTESGRVSIVGYNDMADLFGLWGEGFGRLHSEIKFDLNLKSTRSAPPALALGRSLFAPMGALMSSDQIAPCVAADGRPPIPFRVAHDSVTAAAKSGPIVIVVNPANPLTQLSVDEVAQVFSGNTPLATWGGLGLSGEWTAASIHPFALGAETPLAEFIVDKFGGQSVNAKVPVFLQSRDVVHAVETDRLGIGFAAINVATPKVKILAIARTRDGPYVTCDAVNIVAGSYPFDRFLYIYVRNPVGRSVDPLAAAYLRFILSDEGQALVSKVQQGYLPLNLGERRDERAKLDGLVQQGPN